MQISPDVPQNGGLIPNFQVFQPKTTFFFWKANITPTNFSLCKVTILPTPQKSIKLLIDIPNNFL
jgi:hypothetical protein